MDFVAEHVAGTERRFFAHGKSAGLASDSTA
jgi:hypothetical protein